MKLSLLHEDSPETKAMKKSGRQAMDRIYGKDVKFKGNISGRYMTQPWYEMSGKSIQNASS